MTHHHQDSGLDARDRQPHQELSFEERVIVASVDEQQRLARQQPQPNWPLTFTLGIY